MQTPDLAVPDCWPVTPERVTSLLAAWNLDVRHIGQSAGGRDLLGVVAGPTASRFTFGVIGGTHGHEPGGVAAAMNLLAAVATGRSLLAETLPEILRQVRWAVVPVLNPDARARCPSGFVGLTFHDVNFYASGWKRNGHLEPRVPQVPDVGALEHVGGFYNDAGVDVFHASDGTPAGTRSVEVVAAARFLRDEKCDVVLDLHAHSFDPMFYTPIDDIPEPVSRLGHEIAERVRARAAGSAFRFAAPECVASGVMARVRLPTAALYHRETGAVPFLFEAPQGTIGTYRSRYGGKECDIRDPGYGYDQIVRCCLHVITEIAQSMAEAGVGGGR